MGVSKITKEEINNIKLLFLLLGIGLILSLIDGLGYNYLDRVSAESLDVIYYWVFFSVILLLLWWGILENKPLHKIHKA